MSAPSNAFTSESWFPGSLQNPEHGFVADGFGTNLSPVRNRMSAPALRDFEASDPEPSDDQLLSDAKSGDQRAFVELCRRYSGPLKSRILRMVQNREDAEDVLQDTFLSAYKSLDGFRGACRFHTWITRIGINKSLMLLRKRKVRSEVTFNIGAPDEQSIETWEFPDPSPNPEQLYANQEINYCLSQGVNRLRTDFRCIVERYFGDECSMSELADALGISVAAAKSRLLRARRVLRSSLKKYA